MQANLDDLPVGGKGGGGGGPPSDEMGGPSFGGGI